MAALLLSLATLAHAGTYVWKITDPDPTKSTQSPTYSGGNFHCTFGGGVSYNERYGQRGLLGADGYGNGNNEGDYADCSGMITTTYTWHAGPGQTVATDPLPLYVIVMEKCHVRAYGPSATAAPVVGICDTGLGVSSALAQSKLPSGVTFGSAEWTTTRYTVATGGQTVTLTCTPRAQCSTPSAYASLLYTPAITPITVRLDGTTKDTAGSDNILVGQGCTAYIQVRSLPSGTITFSNFNWGVSGQIVKNFVTGFLQASPPAYPYGHVNYLTSTDATGPSLHWYWSQGLYIGANNQVTCSAVVSVNGTAIGAVTANRGVAVYDPSYLASNMPGGCQIIGQGTSGVSLNSDMEWTAQALTPLFFTARFGNPGVIYYTQLCSLNRDLGSTIPFGKDISTVTNGYVLDTELIYSTINTPGGTWWADGASQAASGDVPSIGLDLKSAVTQQDGFKTFLMYVPPGTDSMAVPLHELDWNINCNAHLLLLSGGQWSPHPPGTIGVTADLYFNVSPPNWPVWNDVYVGSGP